MQARSTTMMGVDKIVASILLASSLAASNAAPTELWRQNKTFLHSDRALIESCLNAAETDERQNACKFVVRNACPKPPNDDAPNPPSAVRFCDWRGIAAWEDEMAETIGKLNSRLDGSGRAAVATSQRAWKISMLNDVSLRAGVNTGGTMEGEVAAETRADETANRTIFLVQFLQELRQ